MAARHEHIQSLIAGEGAGRDPASTARTIVRYKVAQHHAELTKLPLPHKIALSGNRTVIIENSRAVTGDDYLEIVISWTKDGAAQPFDNPWRIVNPPLLVSDPAGDVDLVGVDVDGNEERTRYREDPLAVLTGLMERRLR